jgi:hypothetical protein
LPVFRNGIRPATFPDPLELLDFSHQIEGTGRTDEIPLPGERKGIAQSIARIFDHFDIPVKPSGRQPQLLRR